MHAQVFVDCDRDSIIYLSDPIGPSCHTGARCAYACSCMSTYTCVCTRAPLCVCVLCVSDRMVHALSDLATSAACLPWKRSWIMLCSKHQTTNIIAVVFAMMLSPLMSHRPCITANPMHATLAPDQGRRDVCRRC